jgi:PleD family two-component response regulator
VVAEDEQAVIGIKFLMGAGWNFPHGHEQAAIDLILERMQTPTKVLIVEDEVHALMGLAELISGWGYRTETARDGIEGYEKVLAWDPAIVVTDLKMPRHGRALGC